MIKINSGSNAAILSVGIYRATNLVPNSAIVEKIDSTDEWIQQRTGIESRRFADKNISVVDMGTAAAKQAIERAGISANDVDVVIMASISYPHQTPSGASGIATNIGAHKAAAFDLSAACAGFTYGVGLANDLVRGGTAKHVLVIGAEKLSDFTNPTDRATAFIFADGAGAVVVGPSKEQGIGPTAWGSDSDQRDAITMSSWLDFKNTDAAANTIAWPDIVQEGQRVFRWAVFSVSKVGTKAIELAGITPNDLKAFVPHQANLRIIESMARDMKLSPDVLIADDIRTNGNTSAASIPLAMDALLQAHPEMHGQLALIIGYGAGLAYAAQVVKLP
ncbi:MAG: ketoacyl-ACP synthase III [Actinomycetales bacterium]|nr:ketoacyl-ACP synthase III [Actinomycetales bacterium]